MRSDCRFLRGRAVLQRPGLLPERAAPTWANSKGVDEANSGNTDERENDGFVTGHRYGSYLREHLTQSLR